MNDSYMFPERGPIEPKHGLAELAFSRSRGLLLDQNRQFLPTI